jgi:hypothetical protein
MHTTIRLWLLLFLATVLPTVGFLPHAAQAQDPPGTFRGTGPGTPGPTPLHAGLVIVRARFNGTANFVVSLVTQDPGATVQNSYNNRYLLIDAIGAYNGAAATLLTQNGSYYVEVSQANGPYQITVEQPAPSSVQPTTQTSFTGKGQQVTSPFTLPPGTYTVTASADSSALRVRLYSIDDLGGQAIVSPDTGYYGDELIDTTIPPGLLSVTVDIPAAGTNPDGTLIPGTFLFYMNPEGTGAGTWSVAIQ